ncbi:MAG: hypothetical protein ACI857_000998 [Arenicella sp.]|jgi:hypothetical protein
MEFERYGEKKILSEFETITLEQMNEVALMNRTDTKFVVSRKTFNDILPLLKENYRSLEIQGTKMSSYSTQYFDTEKFNFYLDHHNERSERFKVRIRKYVESDLFFLEIKRKYKGRTDKKRIKVQDFEKVLTTGSKEYIDAVIGKEYGLESKMWNYFDRITLVNKVEKERLTLDLNLGFKDGEHKEDFPHIVIAELKQENVNRNSLFFQLMKKNSVRPNGFSKYCVGTAKLNPLLKSNNFKEKLLLIDKLKD